MENVVLVIHLILAIVLIAVVLLQRSEGGALGIGGGGGGGVSSRPATTALAKVTWVIAVGFIATSITLTILAGGRGESTSVLDQFQSEGGGEIPLPSLPDAASDDPASLLPDTADDAPVAPPAADEPAGSAPQTPPAAE